MPIPDCVHIVEKNYDLQRNIHQHMVYILDVFYYNNRSGYVQDRGRIGNDYIHFNDECGICYFFICNCVFNYLKDKK